MSTPNKPLHAVIDARTLVAGSGRRDWSRIGLGLKAAVVLGLGLASLLTVGPEAAAVASLAGVVALLAIRELQAEEPGAEAVVVVGKGPTAAVIASALEAGDRRRAPARVVRAASLAEAAPIVRGLRCHEVIAAGPVEPVHPVLVDARGLCPTIIGGAEAVGRSLGRVPLELVKSDPWFGALPPVRTLDPWYVLLKRGFDVGLALALGLATLPVLLLVAIAIRFDSPGPILFVQERMGRGGKPFRIYKFRTMRHASDRPASGDWTKEVWTQQGDPRITRAGRILRVTRLDEIPQLWNVVRGEMSFVGPRPEWTRSTAMLEEALPEYPLRYAVLPGLTGWAQVVYRYTNSVEGQRRKLEHDLYYVRHASLRLDLLILLRTALVVLRARGM